MVRHHARRHIGVQVGSRQAGSVSVDGPASRGLELVQDVLEAGEHARVIHHFSQPDEVRPRQEAAYRVWSQFRPGCLKRRGRDAGRRHEPHVKWEPVAPAHDELDTLDAAGVGDLVQVGDQRERASGDDRLGVAGRVEHGAFDMRVSIDESGKEKGALEVDTLPRLLVVSNSGDETAVNGNVPLFYAAGQGVDDTGVAQHQVRVQLTPCDPDELMCCCHGSPARRCPAGI